MMLMVTISPLVGICHCRTLLVGHGGEDNDEEKEEGNKEGDNDDDDVDDDGDEEEGG